MYTQCPQCQTVFRVTATMLKAARGKVRCGRCAHVFNALTFLIDSDEEPAAHSEAPQQAEAAPHPAEAPSQAAPRATTPLQDAAPLQPPAPSAQPPPPKAARTPAAEKRYDDYTPLDEEEEPKADAPPEEIILDSGPGAESDLVDGPGDDEVNELVLEDPDGLPIEEGSTEQASIDEELTLEDESAEEALVQELEADSPGDEDEELQVELPAEEELQLESTGEAPENVPEAALEFTAADLSQVFVEAPAVSIPAPAGSSDDETAEHEILDVEMETPSSPEVITLEGESVVVVDGPDEEAQRPTALVPENGAASPRKPRTQEAIDLEVRQEIEKAFAADPTTRAEFILPSGKKVSLHRTEDEIQVEEVAAAEALERDTSRQRRTRIAWGIGGVVLATLLGLQVIHYNRQALVQSALVGPMLTSIYGAFGSELTPAWKVDAYDVRQWGAAADPRTGTVKVRASVTNGAEHAQPYPLLRLTLMNRFGERLRQSDIEPQDYLTQAPGTNQLLGAGQRVDASIAIVDPGDEAVNFEIDVCLRRNAAVTCASDAVRQRS